jgi:hypothetical protein
MVHYRKIWIDHYGPIPTDEQGRPYEIHHLDGNRKNNRIDNLKCISIQEHYELHKQQGDYKAAWAISKRLKLSADELASLREVYRKTVVSDETRQKMSAAQKGRKVSAETRLKMSIAQKNRKRKPRSETTKAKISQTLSNRKRGPHSEETKKKISAAKKGQGAGRKLSEETKQKIRQSKKKRYETLLQSM